MSPRARLYYECVVGAGALMLISGMAEFAPVDLQRFLAYLGLAWIGQIRDMQSEHLASCECASRPGLGPLGCSEFLDLAGRIATLSQAIVS